MAIYHFHVETKSKTKGQSAEAVAAYVARTGKYRRGADELAHLESGNMPLWVVNGDDAASSIKVNSGAAYWQAADLYERDNGRLCKEIELSLPRELTLEQSTLAAQEFVFWVTGDVDGGTLPYTVAVHRGKGKNPHAHLLISERVNDGVERSPGAWFRRAGPKGGAWKTEALKSENWLMQVRKLWADVCNGHLKKHGHGVQIDHRSFVDQGIDHVPGQHIGVAGVAIQRKRLRSKHRGEVVESPPKRIARHMLLKSDRERVAEIDREIAEIDREKADLLSGNTMLKGIA